MNALTRTGVYVGTALVLAVAAWLTDRAMQPPDLSGFDLVGEPFYPKFDDPTRAARLRVAAYDALNERPEVFTVEKHGDLWRIPSHYDYPAEAKEQLAKTAASVIGIEREALASRRKADHVRLGVVDPLSDEEGTSGRGRGQRITLYDEAGNALVDLIIGRRVEEAGSESQDGEQYYVRRADENQVYRTTLSINLSTKFSDWIEPDLLKLSTSDIVGLNVRLPIFEEKQVQTPLGVAVAEAYAGDEQFRLTREDGFAEWKLEGLDEKTEELDDGPVRDAVYALDDLEIVDVRPKPPGLRPDLSFDPEYISDGQQWERLRQELRSKGYVLTEDPQTRKRRLFSHQGELTVITDEGVVYYLNFGNQVSQTQKEIEVGGASSDDSSAENQDAQESETGQTEASSDGDDSGDDDKSETDSKPGRYLFVRVEFDADRIGPPPVAPEEPEKPAELKDAEKEEKNQKETKQDEQHNSDSTKDAANRDDAADGASEDAAGNAGGEADESADASDDGADNADQSTDASGKSGKGDDEQAKDDPLKKIREQYEKALEEYKQAKEEYERKKKEYDEKVEEGKKKADFLNNRFKDWYYVISADNYDALRLTRDKIVKPKQADGKDEEKQDKDDGQSADAANPSTTPVEAPVPKQTDR